ncbi:MAG: CesT family type III secretion system chaperone [Anaerolineae bacterium]
MDRFEELLRELGEIIDVPLYPDNHRLCRLNIGDFLHVQLECDLLKEQLLIATFIGEIPPGKFRENILKEALKDNSDLPHVGTLAYSERNNQLALFNYLPLSELNGEKIAQSLEGFIEKADSWRIALERGLPSPSGPLPSRQGPPFLGL